MRGLSPHANFLICARGERQLTRIASCDAIRPLPEGERRTVTAAAAGLLPGRQIEARQVVREALEVELLRERDVAHVAEQRDEVDALGGKPDRIAEGLLAHFRIDARAGLVQKLLDVRIARV